MLLKFPVTVLEGSPSSRTPPTAKKFDEETAMLAYVIARARTYVLPEQKERFERAVFDRIVSEDGVKATSEVVAGAAEFAKALCQAYAPQITLITRPYADDKEDDDNDDR
jgi:hypothetical protein